MLTFSHPGSRIQGSKRHPIPDPGSGSATLVKNIILVGPGSGNFQNQTWIRIFEKQVLISLKNGPGFNILTLIGPPFWLQDQLRTQSDSMWENFTRFPQVFCNKLAQYLTRVEPLVTVTCRPLQVTNRRMSVLTATDEERVTNKMKRSPTSHVKFGQCYRPESHPH
jgi:hypothetical protein